MSDSGPMPQRTSPVLQAVTAMIVVIVLGLAFVVFTPVIGSPRAANIAADAFQLRTHYQWLQIYRHKHGMQPPSAGGCRFVLTTWTSGAIDHTVENFDKHFSPGARDDDEHYRRLRLRLMKGEQPWPSLEDVTSRDTHYVGRAHEHLATAFAGKDEALMGTDNEDAWTFPDGEVNVLFANGEVRSLNYAMLQARFGLGPFDRDVPVKTWGPDSPIPECRTLAN